MNRTQRIAGIVIVLALALGLGYTGWSLTSPSRTAVCQACGRAVHANMRTVAWVGGKRLVYCCAACALSDAAQRHMPIRFDAVADYASGRTLRPRDAFAVEGSNVVPCIQSEHMLNPDGQPMAMEFDRCSPSIIAFTSREDTARFAAEHGGRAGTFVELTAPQAASAAP